MPQGTHIAIAWSDNVLVYSYSTYDTNNTGEYMALVPIRTNSRISRFV